MKLEHFGMAVPRLCHTKMFQFHLMVPPLTAVRTSAPAMPRRCLRTAPRRPAPTYRPPHTFSPGLPGRSLSLIHILLASKVMETPISE